MKKTTTFIAIFALFIFSPLTHAADFHVNGSSGTDSGSCGALLAPCKTVEQGVTNAGPGTNVVKITVGNYTERIEIDYSVAGLTLQGGWNDDFSAQDCNANLTVLRPNSNSSIIGTSAASTVNIYCLTFKGVDDTHRNGIALKALGGTLIFSMNRSIIDGFAGSGISLYSDTAGAIDVTIQNSVFKNAYQPAVSLWPGGGIDATASGGSGQTIVLENCLLFNNEATKGAALNLLAINNSSLNLSLTNVTLAGNRSIGLDLGGGINAVSSSSGQTTVDITNSIVWGNTCQGTPRDVDIFQGSPGSTTVNARYSIIGEIYNSQNYSGTYNDNGHNINIDPRLNSTYHLNADSPAIDTALCGFYSTPYYLRVAPYDDIDGDQRPGIPKVSGCDIGADEYVG